MYTLREWAEYYQRMGIWVYPYNHPEFSKMELKKINKDTYPEMAKIFNWEEATGIKAVVGKKGIRVLILKDFIDKEQSYKDNMLGDVIEHLGLPSDYPWIINSEDTLGILLDTTELLKERRDYISYKWGTLLVEGYYILPPFNNTIVFYKDYVPQAHPHPQVRQDQLSGCIKHLNSIAYGNRPTLVNEPAELQQKKKGWWKKLLTTLYDVNK